MSVVDQLETLKKDYLGMRYSVRINKLMVSGIAEGIVIDETMNFVDWNEAVNWGYRCNANSTCPFRVLVLRDDAGNEEVLQ